AHQPAVEAPDRRTTQPALEPWTIRVNRTIPNVTPWMTSRWGRPAGRDRARATDTAPRRPAQNRTWSQARGTASGGVDERSRARLTRRRIAEPPPIRPYTTAARAIRMATIPQ